MNDEERIRNEKLANYFCRNNIKVHVSKNDGIFYNGYVKEVGADFFVINDVEEGDRLVFFLELKRTIEQFSEENKT